MAIPINEDPYGNGAKFRPKVSEVVMDTSPPIVPLPADFDALLVETKFTRKELRRLYHHFKILCPYGVMTSAELKAVYAEMFPGRDVDSYAELVFRAYDHNRDGFVCFEDVARVYSKLTRSSPVEKLSWIFDFYDTHHRGQLGCLEMSAIVNAFYSLGVDKRRQVRPQTVFDHTMSAFQKLIDSRVHYVTKMSFINGCLQDPVIMESLKSWEFRTALTESLGSISY